MVVFARGRGRRGEDRADFAALGSQPLELGARRQAALMNNIEPVLRFVRLFNDDAKLSDELGA